MNIFHLIRASAGTGKTYQLTKRYLELLHDGVNPAHILATTFTRKAAAEIRERVFLRLATEVLDNGQNSSVKTKSLYTLQNLVRNQDKMLICTMDSFCIQVARMFGMELGLSQDWHIAAPTEQQLVLNSALQKTLEQETAQASKNLVQSILGSEAARSIASRLEIHLNELIAAIRQTSPERWGVAMTAGSPEVDIQTLVASLKQSDLPKTKKGTPEKRWQTAVDRAIINLRCTEWLSILADNWVLKVAEGEPFNRKQGSEELQALARQMRNTAIFHALQELNDRTQHLARFSAELHHNYLSEIVNSQKLGFQDVKYLLSVLFSAEEDLGQLLQDVFFRLDTKIHHIMLDEFQDTSLEEWKVLEPLVEELLGRQEDRTFFCVGDIKQAIYGWRGGRAELLDQMSDRWPQIFHSTMVECRRCSAQVIATVNSVFENIKDTQIAVEYPQGMQSWIKNFDAHVALNERQGPTRLTLVEPSNTAEDKDYECFVAAAEKCNELISSNPAISVGLLVRTNKSANNCAEILRTRYPHIPFSLEGGSLLSDSPAVRVVLSALMIFQSPQDTIYRYILANSKLGELLGFSDWKDPYSLAKTRQKISKRILRDGLFSTLAYLTGLVHPACTDQERRACHLLLQLSSQSTNLSVHGLMRTAENTKIKNPSESGLQIMTIHNSKGLEFDAVILPDLNQELVPTRAGSFLQTLTDSPWEGSTQVVRTPKKALAVQNEELKNLRESDQSFTLYESLSVLYVALTRAKFSLELIIPHKPAKNSFASLLLDVPLALNPEAHPNWSSGSSEQYSVTRTQSLPEITSEALEFRGNNVGFKTPTSENTTGGKLPVNHQGMTFGTKVHSELSGISWLSKDNELPPILKSFESTLRPLLDITNFGEEEDSVEVWNEKEFTFLSESGEVITGRWDRVVITKRGGELVAAKGYEFKTGNLEAESGENESQQRQLDYYHEALKRMMPANADTEFTLVRLSAKS